MPAAARKMEPTTAGPILHLAFELGAKEWKLGFATGPGRPPRIRKIQAGNLTGLEKEVDEAKRRLGVAAEGRVVSCYEAGRDGFWLHRYLVSRGAENHVVDSSSIEVSRRKRRRKSDKLDLKSLLRLLGRHEGGEEGVWSVVNVPSVEAEDRRQLHREIATLTEERTERTNRIKSLLATQGLRFELAGDFAERLQGVRLWDGSPLPRELRGRLEREWARRKRVAEEIEALEAERRQRLRTVMDDSALEQVRALMTLRGIGIKSSWLFVMEFFSWRQFRNQKEVGSLAGLAPTPNQSSEEDQSPGIEKAGNVWVRKMATEIAWSWVRNQPDSEITRWFERRFAQAGKRGRRRGITAVARKVLVALWRYLEDGVIPEGAVLNGG
jgi:transposase